MWEFWRSRISKEQKAKSAENLTRVDSPAYKLATISSVNFKDLTLGNDMDSDDEQEQLTAEASSESMSGKVPRQKRLEKNRLIIIMVGLPGRGKTFLCNKLKCYLNWLGHETKHFNVGSYRRKQKDKDEVQDAAFFDKNNQYGMEARARALEEALLDTLRYLSTDQGQVAIFDATNTTEERRQYLIQHFHGKFSYMFIESICTDDKVLEQNYRFKMMYSPDYKGVDIEKAVQDFKTRISHYAEVYEPINNRNLHYIKLIDMVTGRGYMDVNRISGYLPSKVVFFLMQVCKAGMAQARKIWLTRHGESQDNLAGKIGGDSELSSTGRLYAQVLPDILVDRLPLTFDEQPIPASVWTSTLKRTIQTANELPFPKLRWKALDEIHAGSCDGLTYKQIEEKFPEEFRLRQADKLRYRYPAGESYLDVIMRLEPVIIEMEREKECIVVVAHQAVLRAIYGYFIAAPLKDIPTLEVPLHTVIELRPRPDGTMDVEMLPVDPVDLDSEAILEEGTEGEAAGSPASLGAAGGADSPSPSVAGPGSQKGRHTRHSSLSAALTQPTTIEVPFGADLDQASGPALPRIRVCSAERATTPPLETVYSASLDQNPPAARSAFGSLIQESLLGQGGHTCTTFRRESTPPLDKQQQEQQQQQQQQQQPCNYARQQH